MKPIKKSIALLIRKPSDPRLILAVQRSKDDEEHAGLWGLPAGSFREGESAHDLIRRIGEDKLGVGLTTPHILQSGEQERQRYVLQMELWEAHISGGEPRAVRGQSPGVSYYERAEWFPPEVLREGQSAGSLCCRLGLDVLGLSS